LARHFKVNTPFVRLLPDVQFNDCLREVLKYRDQGFCHQIVTEVITIQIRLIRFESIVSFSQMKVAYNSKNNVIEQGPHKSIAPLDFFRVYSDAPLGSAVAF
jgi:hypothetical protein